MTNIKKIRARFTPSPTGLMHLGNLRTALFSYLFSRSELAQGYDSSFLLRIEDTDLARSKNEYTQGLIDDLHWLGIDWELGPKPGETQGEYFQASRTDIYQEYYDQLLKSGDAFWCYYTETELSIQRKAQLQAGIAPRYPGTCHHLTESQIAKRQGQGIVPALRLKIPDAINGDTTLRFTDQIQGPKVFKLADLGDFIIKKQDGTASFMFCNAVDDALMGVTHVIRGEDHITNTPRQLLVLKLLGLPEPNYCHMALIVGHDGKPLSKRNGSHSIQDLREAGYFPLAILNYLARLGHFITDPNFMSLEELGAVFSLNNLSKSAARYDEMQLRNWQKQAFEKSSIEEQVAWLKRNNIHIENPEKLLSTIQGNVSFPNDITLWQRQLCETLPQYTHEANEILANTPVEFFDCLEKILENKNIEYSELIENLKKQGFSGKKLFMPLRVILTGVTHGPELPKVFEFLGIDAILVRLQEVKKHAANI